VRVIRKEGVCQYMPTLCINHMRRINCVSGTHEAGPPVDRDDPARAPRVRDVR
jgi:hypothetical protein